MSLKTYNFTDVAVIFGTRALSGFAEGGVNVTRAEDSFTDSVGADGEVSRSRTNDRRGNVEITLQQTSDSNDFLSESIVADENSGAGVKALTIKDNNGTTLAFAAEAWVIKPADSPMARESGDRVWTIRCASLDLFVGGN